MIRKTIEIGIFAFAMLMYIPVHGQDLLARQAPIDIKMRAIDSIKQLHQVIFDSGENPASDLYTDWENKQIGKVKSIAMPDSFIIDMQGFYMPSSSRKITSRFGMRRRRMHSGLDVKVYVGDTIRAAFPGKVRIVNYERRGWGKYVVIRHPNGLETLYGHLSKQLVSENQSVEAGDVIGLGGNTGRSTGSHLHFETRLLGQAINPEYLFDFTNQDVVTDKYVYYKSRKYNARNKSAGNRYIDNTPDEVFTQGQVVYYKIKRGDTLGRIARKHHTTVSNLCRLNNIKETTILRDGKILRIS